MMWTRKIAIVLALGSIMSARGALGADVEENVERFGAEGLVIEGLAASLTIEGQDRADIELTLRGTKGALERIEHEVRGGVLHLGAQGGLTTVTQTGHNVVIARNGGRASAAIGGQDSGLEAEPMPEIRIRVPRSAPLVLADLVGEIEVEDADGPIELGLSHGRAWLDRARDGRLRVGGSGVIEVGEATGDLTIDVQGQGEVRVPRASLDHLEVDMAGTGEVVIGGVAERGRLNLLGIGTIRVREIRERPETTLVGLGQIEVGNW